MMERNSNEKRVIYGLLTIDIDTPNHRTKEEIPQTLNAFLMSRSD